MKIKVNKNFIWADKFVSQLADFGVKHVCISPGSRSTPLTMAFANNKRIKKHVFVDERQSGFFALGLAKQTDMPVAVVTTSGTATAELYPAIIEAYQNRVPLFICTADRPANLRNMGANQTINQENIYKNHIRFFYDAGLPSLEIGFLKNLIVQTNEALGISSFGSKGPVHFNFPFEKPLEPHLFTDEISGARLKEIEDIVVQILELNSNDRFSNKDLSFIVNAINKSVKGLIVAGPSNFPESLRNKIKELSNATRFPILADGASQFRSDVKKGDLILINHDTFMRSSEFLKCFEPDIILQFGRTPTSATLENFFSKIKAQRILINEFGDRYDPLQTKSRVIKADPKYFVEELLGRIEKSSDDEPPTWLRFLLQLDDLCEWLKLEFINNTHLLDETNLIWSIIRNLPEKGVLFVSNSTPIRDLEFFMQKSANKFIIHQNRGASGIDGIISTALGIAEATKERTFLLTGDLAFYHDLASLQNARLKNINLTIILINNNGGGLFNFLPISDQKDVLKKYFITPVKLDFEKIITAFGLDYKLVSTTTQMNIALNRRSDTPFVIEVKTNSEESLVKRKQYWENASNEIDEWIKGSVDVC